MENKDIPSVTKYEWEKDGELLHSWKINIPASDGDRAVAVITNDAGMEQINNILKNLANGDKT